LRKHTWADRRLARLLGVLAGIAVALPAAPRAQEARPAASPSATPAAVTTPVAAAAATTPRPPATAAATTSCVVCHRNTDIFGADTVRDIVQSYQEDVHAQVGLSCQDCHGGNPDAALATDMEAAMHPKYAANPYRGAPARADIPTFCGGCHSDPTYMKRFRPDARIDQEKEYWTSHHGQKLRQGDLRVATCVDCHGAHGIRRPSDPGSRVYPTHVGETCNKCHGSLSHMQGSTLPSGKPLPVDQYARWQQSVHARAMHEKGDLSAPTCNDCHGNHGAAPPGLDDVSFVCGQCHGREAAVFRTSAKHAGLAEHNEMLRDAGPAGCAGCHDAAEPAAAQRDLRSFSECATCHGNHSIVRPTVALLAPLPDTPCAFCHRSSEPDPIPEPAAAQDRYAETLAALLEHPDAKGLGSELLFDWLVDQALELPMHTLAEAAEPGSTPPLRPEFSRLFEKFRIGKVHYSFVDPATGNTVTDRVTRCTDCHAAAPTLAASGVGLAFAHDHLQRVQEVTSATARAERMLLRAKRGGVEVREALSALDHAVDSQIELQVLVHGFGGRGADSSLAAKHDEGMQSAHAALEGAQKGLQELQFRRRGLALSLVFVVLVLVGLAFRIRRLSA